MENPIKSIYKVDYLGLPPLGDPQIVIQNHHIWGSKILLSHPVMTPRLKKLLINDAEAYLFADNVFMEDFGSINGS